MLSAVQNGRGAKVQKYDQLVLDAVDLALYGFSVADAVEQLKCGHTRTEREWHVIEIIATAKVAKRERVRAGRAAR